MMKVGIRKVHCWLKLQTLPSAKEGKHDHHVICYTSPSSMQFPILDASTI